MKTIALISCSKKKNRAHHPICAKDLYCGAYYKKAYACVQRLHIDEIYILSAKYGLVHPDQQIEYYDQSLNKASSAYRKEWSTKVKKQLQDVGVNLAKDQLIILVGKKYYQYIIDRIDNPQIIIVGKGLSIGKKMQLFDTLNSLNQMQ